MRFEGFSLREKYSLVRVFVQSEEELKEITHSPSDRDLTSSRIKREIREENPPLEKEEGDEKERVIHVKKYSDGYITRVILPAYIVDADDAEDYFQCYHHIPYYDKGYDCTGQAFTSWHRIFHINGRWVLYHSVSYDV